jgi:hypothetical protein
MTNNNMWDRADLPPIFSAKWSIDDSSVFFSHFFFCMYFGMYCREQKNWSPNHALMQWKMLHCKMVVNIITYHYDV